MEARPRKLVYYLTALGKSPFTEWMESIRGQKIYGIVMNRLAHVKQGTLGETRPVGNGVVELKIRFGPGYRVYVGQDGTDVVLLCGGNKANQSRCIAAARDFWDDYNA